MLLSKRTEYKNSVRFFYTPLVRLVSQGFAARGSFLPLRNFGRNTMEENEYRTQMELQRLTELMENDLGIVIEEFSELV